VSKEKTVMSAMQQAAYSDEGTTRRSTTQQVAAITGKSLLQEMVQHCFGNGPNNQWGIEKPPFICLDKETVK
jgi:hypothetical protein